METSVFRSAAFLALSSAALSAHAGLLGSVVNLGGYDRYGPIANAGNRIVGPDVEYASGDLLFYPFTFDFTDNQLTITITNTSAGTFGVRGGGFDITTVYGDSITGATFAGGEFVPTIRVENGRLYLYYFGFVSVGQTSVIDIATGPRAAPTAPGPMAALPFALMALKRRRKA